jgi:hypothetical protein
VLASQENILLRYEHAMRDPAGEKVEHFEIRGTLVGGGMRGSFRIMHSNDKERVDQRLGLRKESQFHLGSRYFFVDESGSVREYHGVLLRRARTEDFVESGNLADVPGCCRLLGRIQVSGRSAYEIAVMANGGDIELLYLDAETALPLRVSYEEDDGRRTIDFSDWRLVGGRRFAFRTVSSDGRHAYDVTQMTTSIRTEGAIDESFFVVPQSRWFVADGVQHVVLTEREGHFFVPLRIAGGTYMFLLDSGAQGILLDRHVVRALGLREEGSLEVSGAQRSGGLRSAHVGELRIGGAALRDMVVSTIDLGASTQGAFRIDGILGYPFFASGIVRIDFAHGTMDFGPPGSLTTQGDYVNVDLDRGLGEATLMAAGIRAPFVIDTGNADDLLLYHSFVDRYPGIVPTTLSSMRSYGLGGSTDSYRSLLPELTIGTTTLSDVRVSVMLATQGAFADRVDVGNVGLNILRKFIVTFDYPEEALYFEKH